MNEDPVYTTSLVEALAEHQVPVENHALIMRFSAAVGIAGFEVLDSYIKAVRLDGGPALQIHSGWTNGFRSEDEARRAVGDDADCWPSSRGTAMWGVTHPVNKLRDGGGNRGRSETNVNICPSCRLQLPASGTCNECSG